MRTWQALLLTLVATPALAQGEASLPPDVARRLDGLTALVGPPPGGELVRVMCPEWGQQGRRERPALGWCVGEGDAARVVFLGGLEIPAPPLEARVVVDLVAEAEAFYVRGELAPGLDPTGLGFPAQQPLVHAVWLRARGRDDLAARAWREACSQPGRGEEVGYRWLWGELARQAESRVLQAFLVRDDATAWQVANWLRRVRVPALGDTEAISARLAALAERERLGAPPPERPPEWAGWSDAQRLDWSLESLPELRARGGDLDALLSDPLVTEIVRQGDQALPALIERVAVDDRVTRWLPAAPRGAPAGLLRVRQVALVLAWELIGVRVGLRGRLAAGEGFSPVYQPVVTATALREFWDRYGDRPLVERMLAILDEDAGDAERALEAARVLTSLGPRSPGGWRLNHATLGDAPRVAQAILGAYTRREDSPAGLLAALVELGDARIGSAVAAAAQQVEPARALDLESAAAQLGAPEPLRARWARVAAGVAEAPDGEALDRLLDQVCESGALGLGVLRALGRPAHPWHASVRSRLFAFTRLGAGRASRARAPAWVQHPFVIGLLRAALNDDGETGARWLLEGPAARRYGARGARSYSVAALGGAEALASEAPERVCDQAGEWLAEHVLGAPRAMHPLRKDRDARLDRARALLAAGAFRHVTDAERAALADPGLWLTPLFPTRDGSATPADVAAGRALFHLPESVGPSWVRLPAVAALADSQARVLVVQGELSPDGRVSWGILGSFDGAAVVGAEALNGEPIPIDELPR